MILTPIYTCSAVVFPAGSVDEAAPGSPAAGGRSRRADRREGVRAAVAAGRAAAPDRRDPAQGHHPWDQARHAQGGPV